MLPFLNLWLHILAAVIWIGGMLFLSLVAVPVLRQVDSPLLRADLFRKMAWRFRRLVWICLAVLILTGIVKDRKSTRLNSSHLVISYAVFCLKKKKDMINLWSLV